MILIIFYVWMYIIAAYLSYELLTWLGWGQDIFGVDRFLMATFFIIILPLMLGGVIRKIIKKYKK